MIFLPAAVLALALGGPPSARSPFAGCQATSADNVGWRYACFGLNARIEDGGKGTSSSSVEGYALGLAASLGSGQKLTRGRATLAGRAVDLLKARAPGEVGGVWVAVLTLPQGKRLVSCASAGTSDEPCAAALEWLAGVPWRAGVAEGAVVQEKPPLTLAGKAVAVPKGCEGSTAGEDSGSISCGPFVAVWARVPSRQAGQEALDAFQSAIRASFDRPGNDYRVDETACRAAGVDTTCRRVRLQDSGRSFTALLALVHAGESPIAVQCFGPDGDPLGRPCSVAVQLPAR